MTPEMSGPGEARGAGRVGAVGGGSTVSDPPPVGWTPESIGRRLCAACGHESEKGSVDVGPDEIGTWPVAGDIDGGVYTRSDLAMCSECGAITVTYAPAPEPSDMDVRWAGLLRPDVLSALTDHMVRTGPGMARAPVAASLVHAEHVSGVDVDAGLSSPVRSPGGDGP